MSSLPTGTVSLLFSDVEGSTLLLARLGAEYADALDGLRRVQRQAWEAHAGVELGTEGDSFYVVFATASAAATAAAQAQRALAAYPWPGGERVRVRMGIHTGQPTVHDGAYVGMDVHRAARIAAAAHGGQVLISETTAKLVSGAEPPPPVSIRDLGSHRLKDIAQSEHLFQLVVEGLQVDFPTPRTLGAASTLPVPATPLVGRDGEVAELTALLRSPGVRLVTLTGPGGTGKTRLAVGVAHGLVDTFPDGLYFVSLETVTTPDVMWTTIAEALDIPPEGRTRPALFSHLAHRTALVVLDNLEQLPEADGVVDELLSHAPQVVIVATSRRPLNVSGELQHAVPPLELPDDPGLAEAQRSGAVQLFVHHARAVKATFALTEAVAADVASVCTKLDGLPLAIELAAARTKLLSPRALLARLDRALDISASGSRVAQRRRTMRDTIAWSHDLLSPEQMVLFRRLSVFAGGADLNAVSAVTAAENEGRDALDLVAELADVSLATITEGVDGEPRVGMLQLVRAYAHEQLVSAGEGDQVATLHALHYLRVADSLRSMYRRHYLEARRLAEIELDNFRDALAWTLQHPAHDENPDRLLIGQQLAPSLHWLWVSGGYLSEGRTWYERALERSDDTPSAALSSCLTELAHLSIFKGDPDRAGDLAARGLSMAEGFSSPEGVSRSLEVLGMARHDSGDTDAGRRSLAEALRLKRESGDRVGQAAVLGNLAMIESAGGDHARAEELLLESQSISEALGDVYNAAGGAINLAEVRLAMGRVQEAHLRIQAVIEQILSFRDPKLTLELAETYVLILVRLGEADQAASMLGAADAMRERYAIPRWTQSDDEIQESVHAAQKLITTAAWEHQVACGRRTTVESLLRGLIHP